MIQLAPIVAADHPADHHEHAQEVCLVDEASKGIGPRRYPAAFLDAEAERPSHPGRGLPDIAGQSRRTDEWQTIFALRPGEIAIPLLTLLADIDRVEQVRTRPVDSDTGEGAEVRDRQAFDRRLREKQVAHWCVGRLCELLHLLQRRVPLPPFPCLELGNPTSQRLKGESGPLARPSKQLWPYLYLHDP